MKGMIVGIDLGTSNSVVAAVIGGQAVVIPDAQGNLIHPSIVSFLENGQIVVGHAAKPMVQTHPHQTVYSAKRLVGRTYFAREIAIAKENYAYDVVQGADGNPRIQIRERSFTIEEVQALVLRHLRKIAEDYLGEPVTRAVITVPANFNEAQRLATKNAGEIAGLEVLRVLNEPTAAALAYGYEQSLRERIAVYDLGGGTFDITILELRDNVFEVLATAGNTFLGGDDLDYMIVGAIIEEFHKKYGFDYKGDKEARQRFKAVAEQVKIALTDKDSVTVTVNERLPGTQDFRPFPFSMTRQRFEFLAMSTVQKTFLVCDQALKLAGLTSAQVDRVVLVGGSTRVPVVRASVSKYFFNETLASINPDEVVAIGAAIFAQNLDGPLEDDVMELDDEDMIPVGPLLIDVTPLALGIETVGGVMEPIVERNSTVPARFTRTFATSRDNQSTVRLQIYEGEARTVAENRKIGELLLDHLPEAARGQVSVDVTFEINSDGMLVVSAKDSATGQVRNTNLNIAGGMAADVKSAAIAHSEDLDDAVIPIDAVMSIEDLI